MVFYILENNLPSIFLFLFPSTSSSIRSSVFRLLIQTQKLIQALYWVFIYYFLRMKTTFLYSIELKLLIQKNFGLYLEWHLILFLKHSIDIGLWIFERKKKPILIFIRGLLFHHALYFSESHLCQKTNSFI